MNNRLSEELMHLFKSLYENLSPEEIKKSVDENGIDGFINRCAGYAAISGGANGIGGFATMAIGLPIDVVNNVIQQFRVTLGVIYYKTGKYNIGFYDFIKIVGASVGVEVGASVTKVIMFSIANKILARMTATTVGKAIPIFGGIIGASVNFGFITAIGKSVKALNLES
jgi:uncharacterized protein (DUF697 family)